MAISDTDYTTTTKLQDQFDSTHLDNASDSNSDASSEHSSDAINDEISDTSSEHSSSTTSHNEHSDLPYDYIHEPKPLSMDAKITRILNILADKLPVPQGERESGSASVHKLSD